MLILQFTGLSGAGKTTLSLNIATRLRDEGLSAFIIDGDIYRKTICRDLSYSKADRLENIRRLGALASGFTEYDVVIIAAINPYKQTRDELKQKYHAKLIWLNCDLPILIRRDTKDLYKRALLEDTDPLKIRNLSGINDDYEIPDDAELKLDTGKESVCQCTLKLYEYIKAHLD